MTRVSSSPVQLLPGVNLVASGFLGTSLSDPHDCHVYLVDNGDEAFLVDAGCGLSTDTIIGNIERLGVDQRRINRIMLTHCHADHAAGAAGLAEALDAEIWASDITASVVESADETTSGLAEARRQGIYPDAVVFLPHGVDRRLGDEEFRAAGTIVESVVTPGHADGHLCFTARLAHRSVVFTGDLVFAHGRVAVLDTPDTNVDLLAESIEAIARRAPDVLLAGHGSFVLGDAGEHLRIAVDAFERGSLPEGLLP